MIEYATTFEHLPRQQNVLSQYLRDTTTAVSVRREGNIGLELVRS